MESLLNAASANGGAVKDIANAGSYMNQELLQPKNQNAPQTILCIATTKAEDSGLVKNLDACMESVCHRPPP